jgi:hypothetical protein
MSTDPEDPSPELQRCLQLVMRALAEPDDDKARALIERSGDAFIADVQRRGRANLTARLALLDRAEEALRKAEASDDEEEERRWLQLWEVYLQAASVDKV